MITEQLHLRRAAPVAAIFERAAEYVALVSWALEMARRCEAAQSRGRLDGETVRRIMAETPPPR